MQEGRMGFNHPYDIWRGNDNGSEDKREKYMRQSGQNTSCYLGSTMLTC